jgi:hypothetical protein
MLGWLRRRREAAARIEAEAEAVMREYAVRAYAEARLREREAKSKAEAQNWNRVALSIAHKTGKRVGFDTATRMAADANFASDLETFASRPHASIPEVDPLDELVRLVSEDTGRGYRIQFLGPGDRSRADDRGGGRDAGRRRHCRPARSGSYALAVAGDRVSTCRS